MHPTFTQHLNQAVAESSSLPQPEPDAMAHSRRVLDYVLARIEESPAHRITFADYMQIALNAPGLGYYSVGNQKFGASGDFITAPEISDLFAACVARQCAQYLQQHRHGAILEAGAGSGRLAADVLTQLEQDACLPSHYWILEPSVDLRQRQADYLAQQVPHLFSRVQWLSELPLNFRGVIVANEVLDAMPVELMRFDGDTFELAYVVEADHKEVAHEASKTADAADRRPLCLSYDKAPPLLQDLMRQRCPSPDKGYVSELAPAREAWINALATTLEQGIVLLIDYGYSRHEYYHAQRHMGTLTCHYRHRVHCDPFFYPGLQDITAFVEFTAIAEAALEAGLHVAGYATQAQFLLSCGLDEIVQARMRQLDQRVNDQGELAVAQLRLSQEMKRLVLPSEMGERFKVLALKKDFTPALLGFSQFDMRHTL